MSIPDYQSIMHPLLHAIADGKIYHNSEQFETMAEQFNLSDQDKQTKDMQMNKILTLTALCLLLLSGCISTNKNLQQYTHGEDKFLVISMLPNDYHVWVLGAIGVPEVRLKYNNMGWDLNESIKQYMTQYNPRIVAPKDTAKEQQLIADMHAEWPLKYKDYAEELRAMAEAQNCQYILLVRSLQIRDELYSTDNLFKGVGFSKRQFFKIKSTDMFASVRIELIDKDSMKRLGDQHILSHENIEALRTKKINEFPPEKFIPYREDLLRVVTNGIESILQFFEIERENTEAVY